MNNKPRYQQKVINQDQQNNNTYNNNNNHESHSQQHYKKRQYNNGYNNNFRRQQNNKYQQKRTVKSKYGFQYDQQKIKYNTQIPQMSQKLKNKPDQNKYNKKVQDIENKVNQLKKIRKAKKEQFKNGNQGFKKLIDQQKHKISLAKACLILLNYDHDQLQKQIQQVQHKLQFHKKKIDLLNKPTQKISNKKKIQQMSFAQLIKQQNRVINQMSTKNLTKAEQIQLNNRLNKISKRKIQIPKNQQKLNQNNNDQQKYQQIQSHKNSIDKLRNLRQTFGDKLTDILEKIQSIQDNIVDFEQNIQQLHQKQRNTDNSKLLNQAAEIKQKIYTLWDQLAQIKQQHFKKLAEYQQEQEKIKYIKWVEEIKNKRKQQWQEQKLQRKKEKLRQKGKKQIQTQTKPGQQKKPEFQRKKINKNQKEIDSCAFLIQYCKDLNKSQSNDLTSKNTKKQVNVQQALKKGQWAKMKNIQVIQSKKGKNQDEVQSKQYKKRQNKQLTTEVTTDRFSHTYFVAQIFDSIKVLPPSKQEELEKTIIQLEDKLQYFLAHPDQQTGKPSLLIKDQGNGKQKTKGYAKVINTEEFPSLR